MSVSIPPRFAELDALEDEDLRKLIRMASAVLKEREPEKPVTKSSGGEGTSAAAFRAVPDSPVEAEQFAAEHGVSFNTLRQGFRFDPLRETGEPVRVMKNKADGKYYIWRGDKNLLKSM